MGNRARRHTSLRPRPRPSVNSGPNAKHIRPSATSERREGDDGSRMRACNPQERTCIHLGSPNIRRAGSSLGLGGGGKHSRGLTFQGQ